MTLTDAQIEALQSADFATRTAKSLYDNARTLREREIRRVAAEGGTYREIARVSGVAYQRVAQIVTGRDAPTLEWDTFLQHDCPACGATVGVRCTGARGYAHRERYAAAYDAFLEQHPEVGH